MARPSMLVLLLPLIVACERRRPPVPTIVDAQASKPEPPPATPSGVIGCGRFKLAVPNETRTQYVILQVDADKMPIAKGFDLEHHYVGLVTTLEVYEKPVTGETHCTDMGTEPQIPARYVAVAGRVSFELVDGKYANATIENARFVDARGRIIDVPKVVATNVRVGWQPG